MCVGEGAFGSTAHCLYCYELCGYCDLLRSLVKIEWLAFFHCSLCFNSGVLLEF